MTATYRSAARLAPILFCFITAIGCRLGGGAGPSLGRVPSDADASVSGAGGASGAMSGGGASGASSGSGGVSGSPPIAATGGMSGGSGSMSDPDAGGDGDADGGSAPSDACGDAITIALCNPIDNTGCAAELGMQCDIDLLATDLAGACVFSAPQPTPDGCLNIPPTLTCPGGTTCVDGLECKKVCLCDAHCDSGECCTTPIGEAGFKVCGAC